MNSALLSEQVRTLNTYTYTEYLTECLNADPVTGPTATMEYVDFVKTKNLLADALKRNKKTEQRRLEHALCLL